MASKPGRVQLTPPSVVRGLEDLHPDYVAYLPRWRRCRDCVQGDDAIKRRDSANRGASGLPPARAEEQSAGIDVYITRMANESDGEYDARRLQATVYEAADKTLDSLLGALFRRSGTRALPDAVEPHLDNIDLAGTPYEAFAQNIASETLEVGRYAVLVDWSDAMTRPVWIGYDTEQITNWTYRIVNGQKLLVQVVLKEAVSVSNPTGFGALTKVQYRVLDMTDEGVYRSRLFTRTQATKPTTTKRTGPVMTIDSGLHGSALYELTEERIPTRQGQPFTRIPLVGFGQYDLSVVPQKPPLLSICNLQIDHYRLAVDQRNGLHLGTTGGLFVIGDGDSTTPKSYYLGGGRANRLDVGATVEFVEYQGRVLRMCQQEKDAIEQRLALMGARLLIAPKRAAESADALAIQREGEMAVLSNLSYGMSLGLTQLFKFHVGWMGGDADAVEVKLNRSFSTALQPQEVATQMGLVQQSLLSRETLLENLYSSDIARDPITEQERIDEETSEREAEQAQQPAPQQQQPPPASPFQVPPVRPGQPSAQPGSSGLAAARAKIAAAAQQAADAAKAGAA